MLKQCLPLAFAFLASCGDAGPMPAEPLVGATPLPVSLAMTGVPLTGLPRLQVTGLPGAIEATWEFENGSCLIASAIAKQLGSIVQVEITMGGNPLANCVFMRVGYRVVARVAGFSAG